MCIIYPAMRKTKKTIAEIIREKRAQMGLSQREFALRIGKTRWDIANYESKGIIPPGDVLMRIQELE